MINYIITFLYSTNFVAYCDQPRKWQMTPQDPATAVMEGMLDFHEDLMFIMILIGVAVLFLLFKVVFSFNEKKNKTPINFTHSSWLEIIWTIIPAFCLIVIAVPSFSLLYSLDDFDTPTYTVKIIGHQWYWTYEVTGRLIKGVLKFDSYMAQDDDLDPGHARLLTPDMAVILPEDTTIRLLVTSADVIHSWAVPSLGIKIDATPGRLTQGTINVKRAGRFFGQCSEICGVNHAFMPCVVAVLPRNIFYKLMAKIYLQTNS